MHDRLSQLLDHEVVGEVTQVGDAFFDLGLGRLCLPQLDVVLVDVLVAQLREEFPDLKVTQRLNLRDSSALLRGIMEISLHDPEMGGEYILQITSPQVVELYERRFVVAPNVLGDLMGTFVNGLGLLLDEGGDRPLRILSGYEQLREQFSSAVDTALQAATSGSAHDVSPDLGELGEGIRRAWQLIPYKVKVGLSPIARPLKERIVRHDRVLKRTIIFAANVCSGDLVYEYEHQHNPYEEYDQVLGWMTKVRTAVVEAHPSPRHVAAMGRASSIPYFRESYPGFKQIVGPPYLPEPFEDAP